MNVFEDIATTLHTFMPTYLNLFNIIYESKIVPEDWLIGLIKPIYKNNPMKPENIAKLSWKSINLYFKSQIGNICERN